jgi:DNA-binding response OmpR family regulator
MKTVLVVDDSASVRRLLEEYLTGQGFRVAIAVNGREAIYSARHEQPDLILLDLMMPEMDGYEFLRRYHQERQTPVIIITAREEEADAVLGLELGADDYIVKPFRMRELVSRIRAVLRRADGETAPRRVLRSGELVVDEITRSVSLRSASVRLTHTEFDLLALLMTAPGRVFTRRQLVEHLSELGFAGAERTLNVHVRNLRAKIEPDSGRPAYVETVFGVGYRFRPE